MVKAIVNISKEANRVLNVIKAQHELKTKSEAINKLAEEYINILEPKQRKMPFNHENLHKYYTG
ncbi:MAG: hypothetical protein AB1571_00975 [Nanoarchaeota archaeon]